MDDKAELDRTRALFELLRANGVRLSLDDCDQLRIEAHVDSLDMGIVGLVFYRRDALTRLLRRTRACPRCEFPRPATVDESTWTCPACGPSQAPPRRFDQLGHIRQ